MKIHPFSVWKTHLALAAVACAAAVSAVASMPSAVNASTPAAHAGSVESSVSGAAIAGPEDNAIREARFETRLELSTGIEHRLAADAEALAAMRARFPTLHRDAQAQFKGASRDLVAHERVLRATLRAARTASTENWVEARANVATNYEAYLQSFARAEAIVRGGSANGSARAAAE